MNVLRISNGGWYGTEAAFVLLTLLSPVQLLAPPRFTLCPVVAKMYQRHYLEYEQLKYVDQTHFVLSCGGIGFWHVPFRSFYRSGHFGTVLIRFFFLSKRSVSIGTDQYCTGIYQYRPEKTGTILFLYWSIPLQYWSFIKEQYLNDITPVLFFQRTSI